MHRHHRSGRPHDDAVRTRTSTAVRTALAGTGAAVALGALVALSAAPRPADACGGFFCTQVPIEQAGEQIVFRQDGGTITAMVRILYQGSADEFSWVVPVPDTPELAVGADATFDELDLATRPDFQLERTGDSCPQPVPDAADGAGAGGADVDADDGVTIEQELVVGPYDAQVVSGEDPGAMARWLVDNGYDLSERGEELLEPYVSAGMKFVALKLRSGQSVGSIRPLVMRYASERPMVPIRLTAVAAQPDMGVLVWLVGDARAVPTNYLHVTPNWTRLNWYAGPQNAYASYQDLITAAMDDAGGQGFATDVARPIDAALVDQLTSPALIQAQFDAIDSTADDAVFLSELWFVAQVTPALMDAFREVLPLPERRTDELYTDPFSLRVTYPDQTLGEARATLSERFDTLLVRPLRESTALLPEGAYLTRVYTTLSPEEMTLDPTFDFNPDMPDQAATRRATLDVSCGGDGPSWTLVLGEGTGREGETVIAAQQLEPFGAPAAASGQGAFWQTETTSADGRRPQLVERRRFETLEIAPDGTAVTGPDEAPDEEPDPDGSADQAQAGQAGQGGTTSTDVDAGADADTGGESGGGAASGTLIAALGLLLVRRRRRT